MLGVSPAESADELAARNLITLSAWHRRGLSNFASRVKACSMEPRVRWSLAPPDAVDPQAHIDCVLREALDDGRARHCEDFKCGITHKPCERVNDFPDYDWPDRRLYIALVSESSDFIAEQETLAIDRYQISHHNCRNRSRGGGRAHVGNSPFFLYIVVGNAHNWHPDGRNAMAQQSRLPRLDERGYKRPRQTDNDGDDEG
jgi:hypothetical protein